MRLLPSRLMQGPGWRILYREERDRLLVSRLRWASGLATVGAMFLAVQITLSTCA